ncbi:hypothetical protein AB0H69_04790 [Streptomyces phaeochromogenes]|uniref:hypothetical protein n=1 Tax=Streptomyces phaeochromogenes TaxID=1923 RepID=UPI0034104BAF
MASEDSACAIGAGIGASELGAQFQKVWQYVWEKHRGEAHKDSGRRQEHRQQRNRLEWDVRSGDRLIHRPITPDAGVGNHRTTDIRTNSLMVSISELVSLYTVYDRLLEGRSS